MKTPACRFYVMWTDKSEVLECDDVIHHTGHDLQGMLSYFHRFGVSCGRAKI